MTQTEFNQLPELLTRRQVVDCGLSADNLAFMRVVITTADQQVAFGKIGAVQLPSRLCKKTENAKYRYRKADVAGLCGYKKT